jgi:hypothetical protein
VVRFQTGAGDFSVLQGTQTGFEDHPASYSKATGAITSLAKRSEPEADHSPPSGAASRISGAIPHFPYISSWRAKG